MPTAPVYIKFQKFFMGTNDDWVSGVAEEPRVRSAAAKARSLWALHAWDDVKSVKWVRVVGTTSRRGAESTEGEGDNVTVYTARAQKTSAAATTKAEAAITAHVIGSHVFF